MATVDKYIVIAFAGQSNSVGYDESKWTEETANPDPDRIKQLGYYGEDNLKVIPLIECAQNLQNMSNIPDPYSKPGSFGVMKKGTKGLHLPLAKELLPLIPKDYGILVVPVAYGGTMLSAGSNLNYSTELKRPINGNDPAGGTWKVGGAYYQTLRDRVKHALDLNKDNKFAGVIWCQGEFDGNAKADISRDEFKKLVEQLAQDWDSYKDRTNKKAVDKSIWFTHETTSYWRKNDKVAADKIWANYKEYLGDSNYIPVPINDNLTNLVNGGDKRTSSAFTSHFGNDAFSSVIAPEVRKSLVRTNMVYGVDPNGIGTSDQGKYTKYIKSFNASKNHIAVDNNNGAVSYVKSDAKQNTFPSIVFSKDVKEVAFKDVVAGTIFVLEYTNEGMYTGIIFNTNKSGTTATNFTTVRGNTANKNLNKGGWDNFNFNNGVNVPVQDFTKGTTTIKQTADGVYKFLFNDKDWFEINVKENAQGLAKNGVAADKINYGVGIIYGWGAAQQPVTITTITNFVANATETAPQPKEPDNKTEEKPKVETTLKVTGRQPNLKVGEKVQLFIETNAKDFNLTTDNDKVANVDKANKQVIGVGAGKAKIKVTATAEGGAEKADEWEVTVAAAEEQKPTTPAPDKGEEKPPVTNPDKGEGETTKPNPDKGEGGNKEPEVEQPVLPQPEVGYKENEFNKTNVDDVLKSAKTPEEKIKEIDKRTDSFGQITSQFISYEAVMGKDAPLVDPKRGVGRNYSIYVQIVATAELEDYELFRKEFDVINNLFLAYADSSLSDDRALRFSEIWPSVGTSKELNTYNQLVLLISTLADNTKRKDNLTKIDINKALSKETTVLTDTAVNNIKKYYQA